jgi:hypothetical protein
MKTLAAVRNGSIKFPKTDAGADRQYRILIKQYRRAYDGGGMFGYDAPTLAINEPELAAYLERLCNFSERDASLSIK